MKFDRIANATVSMRPAPNAEYMPVSLAYVLEKSTAALEELFAPGTPLDNPRSVTDFLRLKLGRLDHEVFAVVFLDNRNQLIDFRIMFHGTLTQTAVYPREIARAALFCNAGAIVCAHNHPSGLCEPSTADRLLTDALRNTLGHLEVRLLDHIIVTATDTLSFAERGLL